MLVVRPVREDDVDALADLAGQAGSGMTTLPADRDFLATRVRWSLDSFAAKRDAPKEEYYFLALEDSKTGDVVGTSAVFSAVGRSKPFYTYKLLNLMQVSGDPPLRVSTNVLTLVNDYAGASELATLFLHPDYRSGGTGRLLSKARYLLIAAHEQRFSETVMAEMRGWVDEKGRSPFWEAIGRHFFRMDLDEADRINALGNSQFIADLMPKFPIYTNILPPDAQGVIGRPHADTAPAKRLLESEGFRYRGAVDIFDAGPCVEAQRDQIRAVRDADYYTVNKGDGGGDEAETWLVANAALQDFRVIMAKPKIRGEQIELTGKEIRVLGLAEGDEAIAVPTEKKKRDRKDR